MTCPFSIDQLRQIVLQVFPRATVNINRAGDRYWHAPYDEVRICPDDASWTYDDMKRLSDALGTTQLNFNYQKETSGYSTYTGGDPSEMTIAVRWTAKKAEGK